MEQVFLTILKMGLISVYCIFFVLIARLCLKKAPKIYSYLLWFIVFVRLICPVAIESPISLIPRWEFETFGENLQEKEDDTTLEKETYEEEAYGAFQSSEEGDGADNQKNVNYLEERKELADKLAGGQGRQSYLILMKISGYIWAIGLLFLLIYFVYTLEQLRRKLMGSREQYDTSEEEKRHGCHSIWLSGQIETAFVFGFFKPEIYLPKGLKEEELEYVIRHEQIHVKRWDYRIRIVCFLIACVHWFNPFVWMAYALMGKDMEMSCDERVLWEYGSKIKKAYSNSLLSLAVSKERLGGIPLSFGEKDVKSRIKNVLSYKKTKVYITIFCVVLCLAVSAGLLTNQKSNANQVKKEQEEAKEKISTQEKEDKKDSLQKSTIAESWADAFYMRDGNRLFELSADKELFKEWDMVEPVNGDTEYAFGWSSPWPWNKNYRIVMEEENPEKAHIYYYALTSQPSVNVWRETIAFVRQEDGSYLIKEEKLDMYDKITTKEVFDQAYFIDGSYVYFEPEKDFFAKGVGFQLASGTAQTGANEVYLEPDTSAVNSLYLSGGEAEVKERTEKEALVKYTFSDESVVEIPMYLQEITVPEEMETEEGTENEKKIAIWVPGKNVRAADK